MFCGAFASSANGAIAMGTVRPELVSTLMVSWAFAMAANSNPLARRATVAISRIILSRLNMYWRVPISECCDSTTFENGGAEPEVCVNTRHNYLQDR